MSKKFIITESKLKELVSNGAKALAEQIINERSYDEEPMYSETNIERAFTVGDLSQYIDENKIAKIFGGDVAEADEWIDSFMREQENYEVNFSLTLEISPDYDYYITTDAKLNDQEFAGMLGNNQVLIDEFENAAYHLSGEGEWENRYADGDSWER